MTKFDVVFTRGNHELIVELFELGVREASNQNVRPAILLGVNVPGK
jgi:hypothetical protein